MGKDQGGLSRDGNLGRMGNLHGNSGNGNNSVSQQQMLQQQQHHFSNSQQNFSSFNQAQNATAQDMDMYKRLKRLEKFEDQLK